MSRSAKSILIDEFGERIKGWDIIGETSMLIGKNTRHNPGRYRSVRQ